MHEINGGDGPGPEVVLFSIVFFSPFSRALGSTGTHTTGGWLVQATGKLGEELWSNLTTTQPFALGNSNGFAPKDGKKTHFAHIILNLIGGHLFNLVLLRRHWAMNMQEARGDLRNPHGGGGFWRHPNGNRDDTLAPGFTTWMCQTCGTQWATPGKETTPSLFTAMM